MVDLEVVEPNAEAELTKEDVAAKFRRLFMRAAKEYLRSKRTSALINARVSWDGKDRRYEIFITNGKLTTTEDRWAEDVHPWNKLSIIDYDRLMIIQSEISKYNYHIELL